MTKYYDSDVDRTQHGQLVSLLEQTALAFEKRPNDTVSQRRLGRNIEGTYTERLRSSLIALISIFLLPMLSRTV